MPLMAALPKSAAVALLRRQLPRGLRFPPGFPQRCVYAGIVRWARRWNLNTPWILEQAWRTLSFWATNPKLLFGTPVRSTDPMDHVCCGASCSGQKAGAVLGARDQHGFQARKLGDSDQCGFYARRSYQPRGAATFTKGLRAVRVVRSAPCVPSAHATQGTRRRGGGHESSRQRRYGTRRSESCSQEARSPRPAPRPTQEKALARSPHRSRWP